MKYVRTLVAAVAAAPVALLLSLLGASTASAETINCPNINVLVATAVQVNANCKATANVDLEGTSTVGAQFINSVSVNGEPI